MKREDLKRKFLDAFNGKSKGNGERRFRLSRLRSCPRLQFFRLNEGEGDGDDLEKSGHFLKGEIFEEWVRREVFPEAESQREVNFLGILGHIDLFLPPDTVLEIKTTSQSLLSFVPNYEHLWQVKAYLAGLRCEGVEDPKGFLIYIPADNPSKVIDHIYEVKLEEGDYEILERQARLLKETEKTKEPPPIPLNYDPGKLPCSGRFSGKLYFCPFFDKCWDVRDLSFIPPTLIDELGEIWERRKVREEEDKVFDEMVKPIKDRVKSEQRNMVTAEGEKYILVATKTTYRDIDREKLKEVLGKDFKKFMRTQERVRIEFRRKTLNEGEAKRLD